MRKDHPGLVVYLSGKMSGLPDHGAAHFADYAERYRAEGFKVISPPEMEGTKCDGPCTAAEYRAYLRRDFNVLLGPEVDRLYLLPNWRDSKGAKAERCVAEAVGIPIYDADTGKPYVESVLEAFDITEEDWDSQLRQDRQTAREYLGSGTKATCDVLPDGSRKITFDPPIRVYDSSWGPMPYPSRPYPLPPYGLKVEESDNIPCGEPKDLKPIGSKAPLALLPARPLRAIAGAFEHGATKYAKWNFQDNSQAQARVEELLNAALRHITSVSDPSEDDMDVESGMHHLCHAGASIMLVLYKLGIDYQRTKLLAPTIQKPQGTA